MSADLKIDNGKLIMNNGKRRQILRFSFSDSLSSNSLLSGFSFAGFRSLLSIINFPLSIFHFYKFLFIVLVFSQINFAQDQPEDIAPPPLKIVSKSEKSQLAAETEVKKRTKLSLELMDARLTNAETHAKKEEYREMFDELGGFHGLMDNTLDFLSKSDTNKGKVLNNFKRVELSLRKYVTRLELIRRDLPIKYEFYVRSLVKYVREARTRAVEPLFGDTVLPGSDNEN